MTRPLDLETQLANQAHIVFLPEENDRSQLAQLLVALANERGGVILIGLASTQKLGKLPDPEAARDRLMTLALEIDPPLIIPTPEIQTYRDQAVLVVKIPPDLPHVYSFDGRFVIWADDQIQPLSGHHLRQLIFARGEAGFENLMVEDATRHALNWDAAAAYARSVEGLRHLSPEEALLKRGCLKERDGQLAPTHAGILIFGADPQRWLPDSSMTVARYTGLQMSDAFIRADIHGTLPEQARKAEAFILENVSRGVQLNALQRRDDYLYPVNAIREVIVNALAHRDYSLRGDSIRLLLFADRLECYSPGRLPGHVTINNMFEERFSRNAAIVQVLFDMGFIERLGYGIKRVIRSVAEAGLPQPTFAETSAGFKVTIFNQTASENQHPAGSVREWLEMGLNERQILALGYLADNGRITNAEYQNLCSDVSPESLRRDLADLVKRDILLRIGEKRATFYILK